MVMCQNLLVTIPEMDAYTLGYMMYFFEIACGISGYLNGINPFDQPGVEAYKKNMFALLGKPGFEDLAKELNARLYFKLDHKKAPNALTLGLFCYSGVPMTLIYSSTFRIVMCFTSSWLRLFRLPVTRIV